MHTDTLVTADAAAVRETVRLVAGLTTTDLERPTPCEGWDLGTLLTHMTVQHRGFAAAAAGNGADLTVWEMPQGWWLPDLVRGYAASAELVLAAFANPAPQFALPEISPAQTFPAAQAISFHLIDYVVHGWDVAATLALPYGPGEALLTLALPIARAVPQGETRTRPGAAFAPALPLPQGADLLDEILRRLGRDPAWTAPSAAAPPHSTAASA